MGFFRAALIFVGAITALAPPAAAAGGELIPPGNSAANQYTEAYPTGGGPKTTRGEPRTPAEALGERNARRLEAQGPSGAEAAAVAAATSPGGSISIGPGGKVGTTGGGADARRGGLAEDPQGSSGFGQVLEEATGTSSGELGWWLPLIIVAVIAWSIGYARRQQRALGPG